MSGWKQQAKPQGSVEKDLSRITRFKYNQKDTRQEDAKERVLRDVIAEGYHANNKKTPQGVAKVEVILIQPPHARKVERTNRAMEGTNRAMERANRAMERILIPLKWQAKGSTT
jgi:23S rRNA A2030 N6-methylase RlmJ